MESLDLNTSRCSTARTLTPREYYTRVLRYYAQQMQNTTQTGHLNILNPNQPPSSARIPHSISAQNNLAVQDAFMFGRHQPSDRGAFVALPS